jgi:multiple sugar transport system permease protein
MKLVRWIVFIMVALLFNFPIIATIATSLKSNADIYTSPPLWIFTPTFQHYQAVVSDQTVNFPRFLWNSVIIALLGTAFALVLARLCALGLANVFYYPSSPICELYL